MNTFGDFYTWAEKCSGKVLFLFSRFANSVRSLTVNAFAGTPSTEAVVSMSSYVRP